MPTLGPRDSLGEDDPPAGDGAPFFLARWAEDDGLAVRVEADVHGSFFLLTRDAQGEGDIWLETSDEVVDGLRDLGAPQLLR